MVALADALIYDCAVMVECEDAAVAVFAVRAEWGPGNLTGVTVSRLVNASLLEVSLVVTDSVEIPSERSDLL